MDSIRNSARGLLSTSFGAFFILASYGILMGALPSELASRNVGPNEIGLVVGCNALGAFCFRFFALNAIDRLGAARISAVASVFSVFSSLCLGITMLAFQAAPSMLAAINFMQGAATSAFLTSGYTYLAQVGDPARRGTRIGTYGSIASIGMLLTPPIGIWIWSPGDNFYLWLLPMAFALPAVVLLPGDHRNTERTAESEQSQGSLLAVAGYAILAPLFALGVSSGMQGGFEAQMPYLVRAFDAQAIIVELYAFFGISVAAGRFGGGSLADRTGARFTFFLGLVCQAIALVLPLVAPGAMGLLLSSITFGVGSGVVGTSAIALLSVAVPGHRSGAAIGLGGLIRDAGFAAGAAATGLIIAVGGVRMFLQVGIGLTAMSLAAAVYIYASKGTRTAI